MKVRYLRFFSKYGNMAILFLKNFSRLSNGLIKIFFEMKNFDQTIFFNESERWILMNGLDLSLLRLDLSNYKIIIQSF